jgi:hypothetical protein
MKAACTWHSSTHAMNRCVAVIMGGPWASKCILTCILEVESSLKNSAVED